ncbi:MAG: hypothetical protein DELT_01733 [Desulfovibrio sp.]
MGISGGSESLKPNGYQRSQRYAGRPSGPDTGHQKRCLTLEYRRSSSPKRDRSQERRAKKITPHEREGVSNGNHNPSPEPGRYPDGQHRKRRATAQRGGVHDAGPGRPRPGYATPRGRAGCDERHLLRRTRRNFWARKTPRPRTSRCNKRSRKTCPILPHAFYRARK